MFIVCKSKTNFFIQVIHDDNLSVDIQNGRINIITDPGTFCYAKDTKLRQLYHSSKSHFVPRLRDQLKHRNLFLIIFILLLMIRQNVCALKEMNLLAFIQIKQDCA